MCGVHIERRFTACGPSGRATVRPALIIPEFSQPYCKSEIPKMTNSDNITSMHPRRAFLVNSASLAAALTVATVTGAAACTGTDPIFAAIEDHKAALVAFNQALSVHSELEVALPKNQRQTRVNVWGASIDSTDSVSWIESEQAVDRLGIAETDAACVLVSIPPTTMAGVIALLQYANSADTDGELWPRDLLSDEGGKSRSWHHFLIEIVSQALTDLSA